VDPCRLLLSLLNRARSKPQFLGYLEKQLTKGGLSLIDASRVFMRMNSVYKQASIERQQIKKKNNRESGQIDSAKESSKSGKMLENNLLLGKNLEILFL
jgi:hypothetical protein